MDTFGWGPGPGGDLGLLGGGEPSLLIDLDDRTLQASTHSRHGSVGIDIEATQSLQAWSSCCCQVPVGAARTPTLLSQAMPTLATSAPTSLQCLMGGPSAGFGTTLSGGASGSGGALGEASASAGGKRDAEAAGGERRLAAA